jgi:hypothetical protein
VIDVALPGDPGVPEVTRGFAACLAAVTELPLAGLPLPAGDLATAVAAWRTALAGRDLGMVPIADPQRFQWPGWWIAVVDGARATVAFGTPPGVVLSPQDPGLLGRPTAELPISEAWAVAPLDPVPRPLPAVADLRGTVEALAVAPAAEAPVRLVDVATARAGRGLEGDRYAAGAGTFSPRGAARPGYELTLVAAEVLDELGIDLAASRRNVATRGIDVNALVGRRFRIGDVLCAGLRLCEPCVHLDRVSGRPLLRPLIHRGGLRADVLTDGEIRVGAPVVAV